MKDDGGKLAKCRMKTARLQTQRMETGKNDTQIPTEEPSPHKRLLPEGGRWRENAGVLHRTSAGNPSGNIKLWEVPKITEIARKLFVQRDEFAICEEKVAKKS
jgi:hypothetical protein